jgi:hypothetical protein
MTRTARPGPSLEHPGMGSAARSVRGSTGSRLFLAAIVATIAGACSTAASGTPAAASRAVASAPATAPTTSASAAAPALSPSVAPLQAIDTSQVGLSTTTMLPGFGAVWAASDDGLLKVSATGTPDAVLTGTVPDIAIGTIAVYAIVGGDANLLVEVDPSSGRALRHWKLASGARSLAVTGDAAYVAHATYPMTIDRVDLRTGRLRSVTVNAAADGLASFQALAAGGGLIWATDGTTVVGLDPAELSVRATVHPSLHVDDLWFGDGSLWAASASYHGGVARIDPTTATQAARIASDAIEVAFSPHGVWLTASDGLAEVDPATSAIVAALMPGDISGTNAAGIAVVGDEVWVDYKDTGQLQRVKVP